MVIVARNLKPISIAKLNTVHIPAQTGQSLGCLSFVKIKKIRPLGREDVFNMEVADHHNFLVNGGLVVHNCIDAARYGLEPVSIGDVYSF